MSSDNLISFNFKKKVFEGDVLTTVIIPGLDCEVDVCQILYEGNPVRVSRLHLGDTPVTLHIHWDGSDLLPITKSLRHMIVYNDTSNPNSAEYESFVTKEILLEDLLDELSCDIGSVIYSIYQTHLDRFLSSSKDHAELLRQVKPLKLVEKQEATNQPTAQSTTIIYPKSVAEKEFNGSIPDYLILNDKSDYVVGLNYKIVRDPKLHQNPILKYQLGLLPLNYRMNTTCIMLLEQGVDIKNDTISISVESLQLDYDPSITAKRIDDLIYLKQNCLIEDNIQFRKLALIAVSQQGLQEKEIMVFTYSPHNTLNCKWEAIPIENVKISDSLDCMVYRTLNP